MSKPGLTSKQRAKLGPYVRDIADLMNLRDWTFQVMHEPIHSSAPHAATITTLYGRHFAHINFAADFATYDPEEQREIVVHELLHCSFSSANALPPRIGDILGLAAAEVLAVFLHEKVELGVDRIANAWAKTMPLPPKL